MTKKVWYDKITAYGQTFAGNLTGGNKILRIEVEQNVLCTGWHGNVRIL